jgi:hypothetical protein
MFVNDGRHVQILVRIDPAHHGATASSSLFFFHAALLQFSILDWAIPPTSSTWTRQ